MNPSKVVVITGASSGIGAEFARHFARQGQNLFLIARREEKLRELTREIEAAGFNGRLEILKADLSEPDVATSVKTELQKRGLTTEILINNAGAATQTAFGEQPAGLWLTQIRLNILNFVDLTHVLLPDIIQNRGKILNVGSLSAFQAIPFYGIYAATKSFMLSLSESLAEELHGTGVTVTCVCPGAVRTEFNDNAGIKQDIGPDFIWMEPHQVVRHSVRAMAKGKRLHIPGLINKLNVLGQRFLPRSVVTKMAAKIYRKA